MLDLIAALHHLVSAGIPTIGLVGGTLAATFAAGLLRGFTGFGFR
jgi:hypothetical protein